MVFPLISPLLFFPLQKSALLVCPSFSLFSLTVVAEGEEGKDSQSFVSRRLEKSAMEVDWDLHAVVRGCNPTSANTTTRTTTANTTASFKADFVSQSWYSSFNSEQSNHLFSFADTFEARNAIEELHELYKPFVPISHPISPPTRITSKPISSLSPISTSSKDQTQFKQRQQQQLKQSHVGSVTSSTTANSHTPRSKRRKNQLKRVCHVPAEGLSSDVWAWRKYGQKPIKGSPYPRGYYRCSSSKGCLARKQVERNRSDPGMFIVTYTAEHNHPAPTHKNSLAGSTRQKTFTPQNTTASDSNKPPSPTSSGKPTFSPSSPATSMEEETVPQSKNTDSRELDLLEDDEEEDFGVSDIGINDDFFVGLEGLGSAERFTDHFPATYGLPWVADNAATTAAGGI